MKQPKFNFTDLLKPKRSEKPGRHPLGVRLESGEFHYYFNELEVSFNEDELELYQEPQKKKLYAYKHKDEWLIVFGDEDYESIGQYNRVPKYDIEYPGSK